VRDAGLDRAIEAAGGVAQLARKIGIAQPSVSNWNKVPAQRVIAVEAATGVSRECLRPDLYSVLTPEDGAVDPIDMARSREYTLLATLLSSAPSAAMLQQIAQLGDDATQLGRAHAVLAEAAATAVASHIEREYLDLFIGLGRGELLPYASYYLTGFLNERPLARLCEDLRALGIERVETQCEPEDHAAILCEIMAGLIGGPFSAAIDKQRQVFEKHLAPWIGRFFADLTIAEAADLYRHVGAVGRRFIEIETEGFALSE